MAQPNSSSALRFLIASTLVCQLALPLPLLSQQPAQQPVQPATLMQDAPAASPQAAPIEDGMAGTAADRNLPIQPAKVEVTSSARRLTGDDVYLLVLDRFTYGARPGDLEKMRALGLSGWFVQQLNPGSIDDSTLQAKLADYPAMQMPLDKMMELYPTNKMIRQSLNGKLAAPGGAAAHAIYADQAARYKDKKANKSGNTMDSAVSVVPLPMPADQVLALPPDKRFKELCHLSLPQLKQLRQELLPEQRGHLTDGMTPPQVEAIAAFNGPSSVVEAEDIQVKLLKDIYSERQLQEIMVDFWLNHFNVYMKKSQEAPYYIADYERRAIRPYALGRFVDLLVSTASSPAMLNYLDASESVGPHSSFVTGFGRGGQAKKASGLNENYAREVMELHTIGVNGGYTQQDVTSLAKIFTGWTVGKGRGFDVEAQAQFDPDKHEPGAKVVFGRKFRENGSLEGIEALKMLAATPQCARFISTKLAVRFVGDAPPQAMLDRMSSTYLETNGDIRRVLLAMVNSPEFFTSATYRAKVKTPLDYVISAVRAAGSRVDSTSGLASAIADLGMPLFGMQTPNGYSMMTDAWNSTGALVSRMNFAVALASNRVRGVTTDLNALLGPDAEHMTSKQKTNALEARLLPVPVSSRTQQLIMTQTSKDESEQLAELKQIAAIAGKRNPLEVKAGLRPEDRARLDTQAALAAGLIFGSPEFQRR